MNLSRIEFTAKQALELAEYLYNDREFSYTAVRRNIGEGQAVTLNVWCAGSLTVEISVLGQNADYRLTVDGNVTDEVKDRLFIREIKGLSNKKHVLSVIAVSPLEDVKIAIKAKGTLRYEND